MLFLKTLSDTKHKILNNILSLRKPNKKNDKSRH